MEQHTVETEQGKQVLVAKCAFSEQRNDSYVLASVVTGTLPRAEQRETTYCCCSYSGLYEWSAFPSGGRGLLVPGNEREQGESMKLLNAVCIRLYLPGDPTHNTMISLCGDFLKTH